MLRGRCLPYGEGVTYWSIAEMVKASAGISDDDPLEMAFEKLRETCENEAVADLLGLAVGVLEAVEGERSQQDIAWAVRSWIEQLAAAQPLVLVFEDVHWGEEPLLEVIEHLASWVRSAPVLLLCLSGRAARRTPGVGRRPPARGHARARGAVRPRGCEARTGARCGGRCPDRRGSRSGEGRGESALRRGDHPALAEQPDGMQQRIPDTLQALIAARIDRLPSESRRLAQRAAVMGRVFLRGALAHLSPEVEDVDSVIDDLLFRDFIVEEERSAIRGHQAFKFKHVLIREVAYAGLSKGSRADLHLLFADWLRERAGEELVEIRAFHLDQATRLLAELDGSTPVDLAEEASAELTRAGRRALMRESFASARKLLVRAVELAPTLDRRYFSARSAWRPGHMTAVIVEMEEVAAAAEAAHEHRLQGRALTALAEAVLSQRADANAARALVERAAEVLTDEEPEIRFEAFRAGAAVAAWFGAAEAASAGRSSGLRRHGRPGARTRSSRSPWRSRRTTSTDSSSPKPSLWWIASRSSPTRKAEGLVSRPPRRCAGHSRLARQRRRVRQVPYTTARDLYVDLGNKPAETAMTMQIARRAAAQGERLLRAKEPLLECVRTLQGLNDRGRLCEAQRSLAEVYVSLGTARGGEAVRAPGP